MTGGPRTERRAQTAALPAMREGRCAEVRLRRADGIPVLWARREIGSPVKDEQKAAGMAGISGSGCLRG